MQKWEKFSEEEIVNIFNNSTSKMEVAQKLGYKSRNDKVINNLINKFNININHFIKYEDLSGKKYGRLQVLNKEEEKSKEEGYSIYKCQCTCENKTIIYARANSLKNGHTQSCGCLIKSKNSKNNTIDMTGKLIDNIQVLSRHSSNSDNRHVKWLCKCFCGQIFIADGVYLRQHKIVSCGCVKQSQKEKIIENILIKNNISYIKQYTFEDLKGNNRKLRFDFALFSNNTLLGLIEFQGQQHYKSVEYFGGEEKFKIQQEYDQKKIDYCKNNNIPLNIIKYNEEINIERILNFD